MGGQRGDREFSTLGWCFTALCRVQAAGCDLGGRRGDREISTLWWCFSALCRWGRVFRVVLIDKKRCKVKTGLDANEASSCLME